MDNNANTELESKLNTEYESKLTELTRLFESLLLALELTEEENKKLKEENDKLKLSEEEKRLLKNIWMVAEGTGFPSVQPMSNARLIEKLT